MSDSPNKGAAKAQGGQDLPLVKKKQSVVPTGQEQELLQEIETMAPEALCST